MPGALSELFIGWRKPYGATINLLTRTFMYTRARSIRSRPFSTLLISSILLFCVFGSAVAQVPCTPENPVNIACLVVDTIGQALAGSRNFGQIPIAAGAGAASGNAYLVVPLTASQPIPSPASGFVYTFDASAGVYVRSSQSFGPILSERADTIGGHKLSVGGTYQRIVLDKLDGLNIHSLPTNIQAVTGLPIS